MNTRTITEHIKDFLEYKTDVENKSLRTRIAYQHDLVNRFLPFLNILGKTTIESVTEQDIEGFLIEVKRNSLTNSVANMSRKLASIKSFFSFLQKRGVITNNVAANISSPKSHKKTICYLTEDEKEKLLATAEKGTPFYRTRDSAILKLFLGTGMRVSELTNLKLKDLEINDRAVSYIRIKRKGGNEARLPVNGKLVIAIRAHLSKAKITDFDSYIFLSKGGKHMEANSIYHLVKHYLKQAEIEKTKWGPHVLRHTVGVSLRRKGIDVATIQVLMGHKKLETTAIYMNVEPQDLEKAVQLL